MRRCTRCVMPETWAGITFDEKGVCSLCRQAEKKVNINWEERQGRLKDILQKYKEYASENSNKYDCIVGYAWNRFW